MKKNEIKIIIETAIGHARTMLSDVDYWEFLLWLYSLTNKKIKAYALSCAVPPIVEKHGNETINIAIENLTKGNQND